MNFHPLTTFVRQRRFPFIVDHPGSLGRRTLFPRREYARRPNGTLPVSEYVAEIVERVNASSLTIIQGETGSGKSTAIPQILLKNAKPNEHIKIVVTQPRRIAAVTLAQRVANELGENVGRTVGYTIGSEVSVSPQTKIQYVTSGWLLSKILANPEYYYSITHLLLDEIHVRPLESDLLYLIVKNFTKVKPKLLLMSATFNPELFAKYFEPEKTIAPLFVGQKRFPVHFHYLDNIASSKLFLAGNGIKDDIQRLLDNKSLVEGQKASKMLQKVLLRLCSGLPKLHPEGVSTLVFLPSMAEIEDVHELLAESLMPASKFELLILHSMLSTDDQMKIFKPAPEGVNRIILATNIGESSVTVPDVKYVVDFGTHKEVVFDQITNSEFLKKTWISRASAVQRAGRCGRTSEGDCFRLYTKEIFENMSAFDTPEIQRKSLASTILKLKRTAAAGFAIFKDTYAVLAGVLEPPPEDAIKNAFQGLLAAKALIVPPNQMELGWKEQHNAATLTELGNFISNLPIDYSLATMIAVGAMFEEHFKTVVIMAAGLAAVGPFLTPHPRIVTDPELFTTLSSFVTKCRYMFDAGNMSDAIALVNLYNQYIFAEATLSAPELKGWLDRNGVSRDRMTQFKSSVYLLSKRLENEFPQLAQVLAPARGANMEQPDLILPHTQESRILKFVLAFSFQRGLMKGVGESATIPSLKGLPPTRSLHIDLIPQEVGTEEMFKSWLTKFGPIEKVSLKARGKGKPFTGTIVFQAEKDHLLSDTGVALDVPIGLRVFKHLFHNGELAFVDPRQNSTSNTVAFRSPIFPKRVDWSLISNGKETAPRSRFSPTKILSLKEGTKVIYGVGYPLTYSAQSRSFKADYLTILPDAVAAIALLMHADASQIDLIYNQEEMIVGFSVEKKKFQCPPFPAHLYPRLIALSERIKESLGTREPGSVLGEFVELIEVALSEKEVQESEHFEKHYGSIQSKLKRFIWGTTSARLEEVPKVPADILRALSESSVDEDDTEKASTRPSRSSRQL